MKRNHNHIDIELDVNGNLSEHRLLLSIYVSPEEPATWGWDGGYPGCHASFEIESAWMVRGKKKRALDSCACQDRLDESIIWDAIREYYAD